MSLTTAKTTADLELAELAELNARCREALQHSEIAGGATYTNDLTRADADAVVSTQAAFLDHAADAGKVVWVDGNIRLTHQCTVRATVAGDRGINGSAGPLIHTTEKGSTSASASGLLTLTGSARLTGVRLRGPTHNFWGAAAHPGYLPYPPGDAAARRTFYNTHTARAIRITSSSVIVDNCEIYGWGNAAIAIGSGTTAYSPWIHHCDFHDNMMTSAGYGIDIFRGYPKIQFCYFNGHRHAICGFGYHNSSWLVEDSLFGPSTSSHVLDQHGLRNNLSENATSTDPRSTLYQHRAGGEHIARRCTFLVDHVIPDATFDRGARTWAVQIRGIPHTRTLIEQCRFTHPGPQSTNPGAANVRNRSIHVACSQGPLPADQRDAGDWAKFTHRDNDYSIGFLPAYTPGRGAPIDIRTPANSPRPTGDSSLGPAVEPSRIARNDPHARGRTQGLKRTEGRLADLHALLTRSADASPSS